MRIALIGTRGVPANYGGFETCAEEVSVGLVERGHEVTAYCRPGNAQGDPSTYKGVNLVYKPYLESKAFGTLSHTFNCILHALRQDFDVFLIFNAANAPLCIIPRLFGKKLAINVDGLEWKRAKWGRVGKLYYQFGEWAATKLCQRIISDAYGIQDYYKQRFNTETTYIAYGAHVEGSEHPEYIEEYGLKPNQYFFVGSRLEPENNGNITVEAFSKIKTDKVLAIAGDANWDSPYIKDIKDRAGPNVKFLGGVYKEGHMRELHANCYGYVHGNEVGGTGPALLKALGYGNCVLALDVNFNRETAQDAALYYKKDSDSLAEVLQKVIDDPDLAAELRKRAPQRILQDYQWPKIIDDYELLLERVAADYYKANPASD